MQFIKLCLPGLEIDNSIHYIKKPPKIVKSPNKQTDSLSEQTIMKEFLYENATHNIHHHAFIMTF